MCIIISVGMGIWIGHYFCMLFLTGRCFCMLFSSERCVLLYPFLDRAVLLYPFLDRAVRSSLSFSRPGLSFFCFSRAGLACVFLPPAVGPVLLPTLPTLPSSPRPLNPRSVLRVSARVPVLLQRKQSTRTRCARAQRNCWRIITPQLQGKLASTPMVLNESQLDKWIRNCGSSWETS